MLYAVSDRAIAESIPVHERIEAMALIHEGGRCYGAVVRDLITGELTAYVAKATAIATGGAGRLYRVTTNAVICEGIGTAIALETGIAALGNMEAVQFHPTGIFPAGILVTEGCRGDGGLLKDVDGHRFMPDYEPEKKELASRDVVLAAHGRRTSARARARKSRFGEHLWLDITQLGRAHIEKNLREVKEICEYFLGIDPVEGDDRRAPGAALHDGRRAHRSHRREPDAQGPVRRRRSRLLGHARLQPAGRQLGGRDGGRRHDRRRFRRRLLRPRRQRRATSPPALVREFIAARAGQARRGSLLGSGTEDASALRVRDAGDHDRQGRHLPHAAPTSRRRSTNCRSCSSAAATSACATRAPGANPELVTAYRTQKMLKLALCVAYGALRSAPKAAARISARTSRAATTRSGSSARWRPGTDDADSLPTLAYEPLDVKRMELPPGWRGYGAKDYVDHPDTPHAQAEVEALREQRTAHRFAVQQALMPYEHLLPERLRGRNERIDEPLRANRRGGQHDACQRSTSCRAQARRAAATAAARSPTRRAEDPRAALQPAASRRACRTCRPTSSTKPPA